MRKKFRVADYSFMLGYHIMLSDRFHREVRPVVYGTHEQALIPVVLKSLDYMRLCQCAANETHCHRPKRPRHNELRMRDCVGINHMILCQEAGNTPSCESVTT